MHLGRAARAVAAVAVAVTLAGCTTSSPGQDGQTPTPSSSATAGTPGDVEPEVTGERIAVVVAPAGIVAGAEGAELQRAARELADDRPDGIAEVRVSRASSSAFARDLAELAVDDGYDVVCVVGTGAAELVLELARARRETRFCATDGRIAGGPVNLVAVAVDPAALVEAGAVAIGTATAPVGFMTSPQVGDADELTSVFTGAVAPPRQSVSPSPGAAPPSGDESGASGPASTDATSPPPAAPQPAFVTVAADAGAAAQGNAGDELAAGRPSRALVLATPGGAEAVAAAAANGAELVVVADWVVDAEGELPPNLLVGLTVDWGVLLRRAIQAALTADAPQVQLLGVDAGVLGALPGQVDEAPAAADRTNEHLRRSAE